MDNENHKETWNNFTKFVTWGDYCCSSNFGFDGNILIINFNFFMNLASISENHNIEKRISITPDIKNILV